MTDQTNKSDSDIDDDSQKDKNQQSQREAKREASENGIKQMLEDSDTTTGDLPQISITARRAAVAVELLNVKWFLDEHLDKILEKLEECEGYAESADFNGGMMFMALSLPVINGVIHVASTRKDLHEATNWVLTEWNNRTEHPDPEKIPILSALTLIYIVAEGWKKYQKNSDDKKRNRWQRIRDRIQELSTESLDN